MAFKIKSGEAYTNMAGDLIQIVAEHPTITGIFVGVNLINNRPNLWMESGEIAYEVSGEGYPGSNLIVNME